MGCVRDIFMENLKFLQDIFFNIGKEEFQYTFTSKTESENKVTLALLHFLILGVIFYFFFNFDF